MVHYEGVFFDKKTQEKLILLDKNKLPIINDEIHCTFKPYPSLNEIFDEIVGEEIELEIIGYGNDGKNSGLEVKIPKKYSKYYINYEEDNPEKLKTPHITLSISEGAKAYKTKDLNFIPYEKSIKIKGHFGYWIKEDNGKEYLSFNKFFE